MSLYLALVVLIVQVRSSQDLARLHRSAWTGAGVGLLFLAVVSARGSLQFAIWLDLHAAAALTFQSKRGRLLYSLLASLWLAWESVEASLAPAAKITFLSAEFVAFFMGALLGFGVAVINEQLIRRGRALPLRISLYWMTFIGTFFALFPMELHKTGSSMGLRPTMSWTLGLLLAALAILIWRSTTLGLRQARGTPDPSDVTQTLHVAGIYQYIRNPMQLGHISAVWSSFFFFGTWNHLLYAAGFSACLVSLVRWHEEDELRKRFGDSYVQYRNTTPAYLPVTQIWQIARTLFNNSKGLKIP